MLCIVSFRKKNSYARPALTLPDALSFASVFQNRSFYLVLIHHFTLAVTRYSGFIWLLPVQPSVTVASILFFSVCSMGYSLVYMEERNDSSKSLCISEKLMQLFVSLIYLIVYVIITNFDFRPLILFGVCSKMKILISLRELHSFSKIILTISKWRVEAFRNICVYVYVHALPNEHC